MLLRQERGSCARARCWPAHGGIVVHEGPQALHGARHERFVVAWADHVGVIRCGPRTANAGVVWRVPPTGRETQASALWPWPVRAAL